MPYEMGKGMDGKFDMAKVDSFLLTPTKIMCQDICKCEEDLDFSMWTNSKQDWASDFRGCPTSCKYEFVGDNDVDDFDEC